MVAQERVREHARTLFLLNNEQETRKVSLDEGNFARASTRTPYLYEQHIGNKLKFTAKSSSIYMLKRKEKSEFGFEDDRGEFREIQTFPLHYAA